MKKGDVVIRDIHLPQFERLAHTRDSVINEEEELPDSIVPLEDVIENVEKKYIMRVMKECGNNNKSCKAVGDLKSHIISLKDE